MATEISDRLLKNLKKLAPVVKKHGLEAFRLYDRDIPEYPFIVDVYKNSVVLYDRREDIDFSEKKANHLELIKKALNELLKPIEIIEKRRTPQRLNSQRSQQYQKLGRRNDHLKIKEPPAEFWVNLHDYIDTGLFLDHRLVRQKIYKELKPGQRFLNLFSYTASVSVFAALAGAHTVSVDLSNTYSEWAEENFKLNQLSLKNNQVIVSDVFDWLRENSRDPRYYKMFDFIFIDPPTFSNSKKTDFTFEVEKDHFEILQLARMYLKDSGRIIFSNNKRSFKLDPRVAELFKVKNISSDTLPFDFRDKKIRHVFELNSLTTARP